MPKNRKDIMKKLILLIFLTVVTLPQLSFAEDEVLWETEKIGGLNEVEVSPLGKLLYNTKDSIIQVRNIEDGKLVEEIIFPNTTRLDHISISADGRFMAVSGQTKYVIIYDLQARREVKRLTTIAYERVEYGEKVVYMTTQWLSSSISPDGTKITGIAAWGGTMTNFVVLDILTEKVLFEQRRITYDNFNPSPEAFEWMSAEFSSDGKYIVAQLDYGKEGNKNTLDSVYIYNAKNLEIYDVVLNTYSESKIKLTFSSNRPMFAFYKTSLIYI
jgi:WD40 repeat protein